MSKKSERNSQAHVGIDNVYINKAFIMNYVQGSTEMQVIANNISQSAVQKSATKADNSPNSDSVFVDYLKIANSEANNITNDKTDKTEKVESEADITISPANSSSTEIISDEVNSETAKNDLLSEIALFFVNNNIINMNNIPQVLSKNANSEIISETDLSISIPNNDIMQKIQSLIKQATETNTDSEAEAVNSQLRKFAAMNTIGDIPAETPEAKIFGQISEKISLIDNSISESEIGMQSYDNKIKMNELQSPENGTSSNDGIASSDNSAIKASKSEADELILSDALNNRNKKSDPTIDSTLQSQISNPKLNITKQENIDELSGLKALGANEAEGTTIAQSSTGATNNSNSGGNRTGQENKQDNTQRDIAFELTAKQKEGNTINSKNSEVRFAEYDKSGTLRISDIPRYINKIVSSMPENGIHKATINLSPASLGKVSIEISLNGNMANIIFKTEGIDAVKSIESQLSNLKDNLSKNGIKIESVGVEQSNIDLNNSGNKGQNSPDGGNSQQNQEKIKQDYLNYLRRDNLERLSSIDLSNSESLPIRGKSQSNNNFLERYI